MHEDGCAGMALSAKLTLAPDRGTGALGRTASRTRSITHCRGWWRGVSRRVWVGDGTTVR